MLPLLLAACGGSQYYVDATEPLAKLDRLDAALAATRIADGAKVFVRARTVMLTEDQPGYPPGTVRIQGRWRSNPKWKTAVGLIVGGIIGTAAGAVITLFAGCFNTDGDCDSAGKTTGAAGFGIVWSLTSDFAWLVAAPILFGVSAREWPREIRF